jgi:hypothetical protein
MLKFQELIDIPVTRWQYKAHHSAHANRGVLRVLYEECVEEDSVASVEGPPDEQGDTEVYQRRSMACQGDLLHMHGSVAVDHDQLPHNNQLMIAIEHAYNGHA